MQLSRTFISVLIFASTSLACGDDGHETFTPMTGIYVQCDSNGTNYYWHWNSGGCEDPDGQQMTNCYYPAPATKIAHCYEHNEWFATDTGINGDTGDIEETEG